MEEKEKNQKKWKWKEWKKDQKNLIYCLWLAIISSNDL